MIFKALNKISFKSYLGHYKEAFATQSGQIVLADLCKKYRVLRPFPIKGESDAINLAFCEGQRQVVLEILNKLNYDTNKLNALIEENSTEVKND